MRKSRTVPQLQAVPLAAGLAAQLLDVPMVAAAWRSAAGSWTNHTLGMGVGWESRELPLLESILSAESLLLHLGPVDGVDGARFLAGIPLGAPGLRTGVLLVMDTRERNWSGEESRVLHHIGAVIGDAFRAQHRDELETHGDPLQPPEPEPGSSDALRLAEQALTDNAVELARYSEDLRQLHRLATADFVGLDALLADYLRTGCEILGMPYAGVTEHGGVVRFLHPRGRFAAETLSSLERIWPAGAPIPIETFTFPNGNNGCGREAPLNPGAPLVRCSIGTPIYAGDDLFGILTFWSGRAVEAGRFTAHDREVLELMAKSLGRSIYEERLREEQARLAAELSRQAQQDPLTGLSNRLQFLERLESELVQATAVGATLAVAFLDLDRFKQVNDTLGHAAGDEVLRQAAARLLTEVSPDESVARVGGDEFTILFTGNPTRERVALTVERILDVLRNPYPIGESELFITGSMGISFFPDDGIEARDLLQRADGAMYRIKNQGKNDFRFFTPDIVIRGSTRMELETQLRRALEKGELKLSFMPLVSTDTGRLSSFEALLSWSNPRFGKVGPSRFIPIAEESGMIIPIGTWVLNEVCRQGAEWYARGLPLVRTAINVSALQFARADFVDTVSNALLESGYPPQSLELELTESTIMRDMDSAAQRMLQLREVGVSIAIDDFGTGYSSLNYLRRLPVDSLKIDQSFVAELGSAGTALPLIHTIVVLAHNMGLAVVAEGVETREQLDGLRTVGCDMVQGHLFGRPLTPAGVEALVSRPGRDVPLKR